MPAQRGCQDAAAAKGGWLVAARTARQAALVQPILHCASSIMPNCICCCSQEQEYHLVVNSSGDKASRCWGRE